MALRMPTTSSESLRSPARWVAVFVIVLTVVVTTLVRLLGPAPGPPAAEAIATLRVLLADNVPHPVESPANAIVRDRIVARFRALGYAPVIQKTRACSQRWKRCANVENIVVFPPAAGDIVLGVAHYDSVPKGPGASDDGVGVATMLECARILRNEKFRNPIGFLVTDGEEKGLLGAEGFVTDAQLSGKVRAIVNVDNRGTSGPSYLFETSRDNRDLVPLFNTMPRPITTSVFYTIYSLLPNDTDATVFKRAGKIVVNFGAIAGVEHYHQPSDDLAHVGTRTLEHHSENALAMLRALGQTDLQQMRKGNDVYFDILGFRVFWWPEPWTIWIAVANLVVLLVLMRGVPAREIALSALLFLAAIVVAAVIGIAAMKLTPHRLANPAPAVAAMWIAGILATLVLAGKRVWQGRALVSNLIAIALSLTLPGVSFLFLVPAIAMNLPLRPYLATAVAAILFSPLGLVLYIALGGLALPVVAVVLAIVASTFTK